MRAQAITAPTKGDAPQLASLFAEPEEDIRLLGDMIREAKALSEILARLPFERYDDYRGQLRAVVSISDRMRRRAAKLLGEPVK